MSFLKRMKRNIWLGALMVSSLCGSYAHADGPLSFFRQWRCPPPDCNPCTQGQGMVVPSQEGKLPGTTPETNPIPNVPSIDAPSLAGESFAALGGESTSLPLPPGGYLDVATPVTMFRLRYDSAYDSNRPDRAEYFYAKCGCFRVAGIDPKAGGPPLPETRVDYQDISGYLEYAATKKFSGFIEVPVRFLNPTINANTAGLADLKTGFKYAMIYNPDQVLSFQTRVYIPTGDADRGLGTYHVSVEPGLLYYQRLGERWFLQGQIEDWIAVNGTDFRGNVLNYGAGVSYLAFENCNFRVLPVLEVLGWTTLSGMEFAFPENQIIDSAGKTTVNAKFGMRVGFGPASQPGMLSGSDFYVGYGRALTGDVWYKDIIRLEYRLRF